jgi:hypothetical protein
MDSGKVRVLQREVIQYNSMFQRWLYDRKEFIIPFLFLFIVVDPLITFIGTAGFGIPEGNMIVSTMMEEENGWFIWIAYKIIFGMAGTLFMYMSYYMINTQKLTKKEKARAIIFEYGAWSFIICFLFLVIIHWAVNIIGIF